jgi:hypothetical protein
VADKDQGPRIAWALFDSIVESSEHDRPGNPWSRDANDALEYSPDYEALGALLGVPIFLGSVSQSGLLAIAVDVWIAYELRRSGFDRDSVWPRASQPRVLPRSISKFVAGIRGPLQDQVVARYDQRGGTTSKSSATPASAKILGKNYVKQVDVVISDWATGPELLISTKRMDASYGNNALNRVEESYGDAKNLRLRHPLAALGFVFALSSGIYDKNKNLVPKLKDLLAKLGQEDDAYHAVMLVMPDYDHVVSEQPSDAAELLAAITTDVHAVVDRVPRVRVLLDESPREIAPSTFFEKMIGRMLDNTPVDFHEGARDLRSSAPRRSP